MKEKIVFFKNPSSFEKLNKKIEILNLTTLPRNGCLILKIKSIFDLIITIKNKPNDFNEIFGQKSQEEITEKLKRFGIDEFFLKKFNEKSALDFVNKETVTKINFLN